MKLRRRNVKHVSAPLNNKTLAPHGAYIAGEKYYGKLRQAFLQKVVPTKKTGVIRPSRTGNATAI